MLTFDLLSLAATHEFAARLASVLVGGDVVGLRGDLGAGKSELARAVIRARAGAEIDVPSPTFTIVQDYPLKGLTIRHIDLYRINDPEELFELGLEEAPEKDQAWLVEWPERAARQLAGSILDIVLLEAKNPTTRTAHIKGNQAWTQRLPALAP